LMEHLLPRKIAVSFPSMRVGTLSPELMTLIRQVRKTGFTLAPEAGSERLRRIINKKISEQDLLAAADSAFALGWRLLKLYFMVGLPGENQADLDALVALCLDVWRLAKPTRSSVNVSLSPFVPKPQTPFQWAPQISGSQLEHHLSELRTRLKRPGLRVKWHHPGHTFLEAVFARGDRRLGKALMRAWELGARFDGWSEVFRSDLWQNAFADVGLDASFYAHRERSLEEILPWDHLSAGVAKTFLLEEYRRSLEGLTTGDCRFESCSQCGICDHRTVRPQLHGKIEEAVFPRDRVTLESNEASFLYWFRYSKIGSGRYYGQLEVAQSLSRAIRRAGLPAVMTKGFHPHVKLSFVEALPVGLESLVEEAYLSLSRKLEGEEIKSRLNAQMPVGLNIEEVISVAKPLSRPQDRRVEYIVSQLLPWRVRRVLQSWSKRLTDTLVKRTKRGEVRATLGEILLDVRQVDESTMELDLYEGSQINFRPMAILHHLLEEPLEALLGCRICKVAVTPLTGLEEEDDVLRAYHKR
jgi:radical SAM-linked protein